MLRRGIWIADEILKLTEQGRNCISPFLSAMIGATDQTETEDDAMKAIKTVGLVKRYKSLTAVDRIDLEIEQGEVYSLLGVNGAGKTTTIKMLTGLTKPSGGEAFVGGYSISEQPEQVKRVIGVSPQETAVAPNLSVKENLELICGIHGFPREKIQRRIREVSGQFGLDAILERKAGKLSGGWQRRVSIAMAMISEPQILVLDEPTLGLDVLARHDLWDAIHSLKGQVTMILTTHYMEEAEALSDRVGIMKDGRILAVGTVEELKKKAGTNDFEAAFVSIVKEAAV